MPPRCSSMPPGKLESPRVCQRTSFCQCQTSFTSRRAMRRELTKPLASVSGLHTKAWPLAFALQTSAYGTKRHAQCADEMSAFGSRRTLTNRCFPISIYELHGLEHTATPSRLAHQIAHQTHLAFPRLSARNPGKPENPWGSKGQENSGNTFGNALANRRLQPLGHVSAKANQLVAVLHFGNKR